MDVKMQILEAETLGTLMEGGAVSLERALLVLSGLRTDEEIHSYEYRIGRIFELFLNKCGSAFLSHLPKPPPYLHRTVAACLFDYLWVSKPKRFGDHFLLAEVIDAQLHCEGNRAVGTCIGLTSLYSVLGLRAGLSLSILVSSDHVLSRLRAAEQVVDMDHTDPMGFDCPGSDEFREFPLRTLTANILNSRGLRHEGNGRVQDARADYERAIGINPQYASAYSNRGNMRFRTGDLEGATGDYTEAIRLNPYFHEAYCNRGMARQKLGLYDAARQDYLQALALDSSYSDAARWLQSLDGIDPGQVPGQRC